MLTDSLYTHWQRLLQPYTGDAAFIESGFQTLIEQYAEPQRQYHNVFHIHALIQLQQAYQAVITDNESLLLAVFFHDIIYDVKRSDNEELSAEAATAFLQQTSYPADKIGKVAAFIRATQTHINTNNDSDLDHFLDFDLSILSADTGAYQAYTAQIRAEYAIYPDNLYKPGRTRVLQHFLQMPSIYKTVSFKVQHEAAARHNMTEELKTLE